MNTFSLCQLKLAMRIFTSMFFNPANETDICERKQQCWCRTISPFNLYYIINTCIYIICRNLHSYYPYPLNYHFDAHKQFSHSSCAEKEKKKEKKIHSVEGHVFIPSFFRFVLSRQNWSSVCINIIRRKLLALATRSIITMQPNWDDAERTRRKATKEKKTILVTSISLFK